MKQIRLVEDHSNVVLHLLLIEDNSADVLMIREALRTSSVSADVVIAYDGEQALRILEEPWFRPDFIILDLNLPKVDGHTILERHKTLDGPPVIVFTGSARVDDRRRALANGAKDYVVKPVDFRQFTKVVQEIVERWGNSTEVSLRKTNPRRDYP